METQFFVDHEVIVITRQGVWLADGHEITHEPTRRLFARSLRHDAEGYRLYIGRETKLIQVEDTAYFISRIDGDPQSGYELSVNDETRERLDPATLRYAPGRLTCRIKNGTEEAKFLSAAYWDLLKHVEEDAGGYFVEIHRQRVELG